jgi:hypothetical protein
MYIFNGLNKTITIGAGITDVDVQHMYSSWKVWLETGNAVWPEAFRTFGGDPTISGQFAPSYYFLMNGWRVVISDGEDVSFGVNLYTEEGDTPFIVGLGSSVTNRNSDAVIVDKGIAETLDYNGEIHIDASTSNTGFNYPVGTTAQPVNNFSDALTIGNNLGINTFHIHGTIVVDVDVTNSTVYGGNITDILVLQGVDISNTTFKECTLAGSYTGYIAAETCQLANNLTGDGGAFKECGLLGTYNLNDNADLSILSSSSLIAGMTSPEVNLGLNNNFNLRKYSGGMLITGCNTGTTSTLEFLAGKCRIDNTNIDGTIVIRGIVELVDTSAGTTITKSGIVNNLIWETDISVNVVEGQAAYELQIARLQAALAAALSA